MFKKSALKNVSTHPIVIDTSETSKRFVYNTDCKLGDGYDEQFFRVIKHDSKPRNKIREKIENFHVKCNSASCVFPPSFELGLLLDDDLLKTVDAFTIFDDKEYYLITLTAITNAEYCDTFSKLPDNVGHVITQLIYGIRLACLVPKEAFPSTVNKEDMISLFESGIDDMEKFPKKQRRERCLVFLNPNLQEKEMSISDIFRFLKEYMKYGKYKKYETLVVVGITEIRKMKEVLVNNKLELETTLMNMYIFYRKIEKIFDKINYPYPKGSYKFEKSLITRFASIQKLKNDLNNIKKINFIELHPLVKELFWRYIWYLEHSIQHRIHIDEGKFLPAMFNNIEKWLKELNTWQPYNSKNKIVIIPNGFDDVLDKFIDITNLHDVHIEKTNKHPEPFLHFYNVKGYFGFVDMSNASDDPKIKGNHLRIPCPKDCTGDVRYWLCNKCGDLIKSHQTYIACNCGCKLFDKKLLVCNYIKHRLKSKSKDNLSSSENTQDEN